MNRFIKYSRFLAGMVCVSPAGAEGPTPFPDFTAKRVKPPKSGSTNRINIHSAPQAPGQPEQQDRGPPAPFIRQRTVRMVLGQGIATGSKRRTRAFGAGDHLHEPRPASAGTTIAADAGYRHERRGHSALNHRNAGIASACLGRDHGGDPCGRRMRSGAGAKGLMQLMPDTAERFGVADSFELKQNITGGVKYLDWLMEFFYRDPILVLAGYNAGEGCRDPLPKRAITCQRFWPRFRWRAGCAVRPELISDGCVLWGVELRPGWTICPSWALFPHN